MSILSAIPEHAFDERLKVISMNMRKHMHAEKYNSIVHESITVTFQQIGIPLHGVHESVFKETYNPVETESSISLPIKNVSEKYRCEVNPTNERYGRNR